MNFQYISESISTAVIAVCMVAVIGSFTLMAVAAPHDDYFTNTTQDAQNNFIAWFSQFDNADTTQCDAFDAIFSVDCINSAGEANFSSLAGVAAWIAQISANETEDDNTEVDELPSVTLLDQRCVNYDGVVELGFMHVTAYELKRGSDIYAVGDLSDEKGLDFQTFAGLPDGTYQLMVFNSIDDDRVSFGIDCDDDEGDAFDSDQLSAVCSVYPNNPSIDESVTWQVSASGGTEDYNYNWYGDVHGASSSISVGYTTPGTKEGYVTVNSGSMYETVRCEVSVQDDGDEEVDTQMPSRTIEEF